jgi:transcriptional regulator with XRE-family HTH domain
LRADAFFPNPLKARAANREDFSAAQNKKGMSPLVPRGHIKKTMNARYKINLVGPRIRELRMKRHWTQEYLSRRIRSLGWYVTRNTLAKMENTTHLITDCDLLFLAKALKVKIKKLFPADSGMKALKKKIQFRRSLPRHASRNGILEISRF